MTESDVAISKRRKAFLLADEITLTRQERHELATYILRRDVASWGDLNEVQMERLLNAMEGYQTIQQLLLLRP